MANHWLCTYYSDTQLLVRLHKLETNGQTIFSSTPTLVQQTTDNHPKSVCKKHIFGFIHNVLFDHNLFSFKQEMLQYHCASYTLHVSNINTHTHIHTHNILHLKSILHTLGICDINNTDSQSYHWLQISTSSDQTLVQNQQPTSLHKDPSFSFTHTHTHTQTRARAHTHTQVYSLLSFPCEELFR
jgi:hypothetical protein